MSETRPKRGESAILVVHFTRAYKRKNLSRFQIALISAQPTTLGDPVFVDIAALRTYNNNNTIFQEESAFRPTKVACAWSFK